MAGIPSQSDCPEGRVRLELAVPGRHAIANALAAENLKLGRVVIADCVNPVVAKPRRMAADRFAKIGTHR